MSVIAEIEQVGVVPVVTLAETDAAPDLTAALAAGGLTVVEITLRTTAGLDAIRRVAGSTDATVGAGSIRSRAEAEAAIDAGARFLVSPGLDDDTVRTAQERGIEIIPGIATATELMRARALGIDVVKLFPAEATGGAATVAALAAVFPDVRFLPTGGISPANAADYLRLPAVLAVGGSWMAPAAAIDAGDWAAITDASTSARALVEDHR